ncbi:MerR family DNA-binding transcriptional regulator [Streptomyces albospinus]|uniref:MerR family DNA-binding transcriptional regulator n=1 Tax=Streptomyces albospinus TaxID=285515 RepID=UPI00357163D1
MPPSIGELARRAGVTVKTVRHCSDEGLLPDAGRKRDGAAFRAGLRVVSAAGEDPRMRAYRRYVDEVTGGGGPTMGAAHDWLVGALGRDG